MCDSQLPACVPNPSVLRRRGSLHGMKSCQLVILVVSLRRMSVWAWSGARYCTVVKAAASFPAVVAGRETSGFLSKRNQQFLRTPCASPPCVFIYLLCPLSSSPIDNSAFTEYILLKGNVFIFNTQYNAIAGCAFLAMSLVNVALIEPGRHSFPPRNELEALGPVIWYQPFYLTSNSDQKHKGMLGLSAELQRNSRIPIQSCPPREYFV